MAHAPAVPVLPAGRGAAPPWWAAAPLTSGRALAGWQFAPGADAAAAVLAAAYLAGMWRVARRHPARPWR
jgi:hypothetical protein